MLIFLGLVEIQKIVSAISSGLITLVFLYTWDAFSLSPLNRTIENSVSARPGSSDVTLMPLPTRSALKFNENWLTNAFVPP